MHRNSSAPGSLHGYWEKEVVDFRESQICWSWKRGHRDAFRWVWDLQSERLHSSPGSCSRPLPQSRQESQRVRMVGVQKDRPDHRLPPVTNPHTVTQTKALSAPSSLSLNTCMERSCCVFIYPQTSLLSHTQAGAWPLRRAWQQHHTWGGISVLADPAPSPVPVADPAVPQGLCGSADTAKKPPTTPRPQRRLPL